MKIVLAKRNINLFGRVIHNLAKVRDEICVEISSEGFNLKSVNSIQTCFGNFLFRPAFFSDFIFTANSSIYLLVPSKALLHVFKNLHAIERTTDKILISFENGKDFIGFLLIKADGLQTQYELNYNDSPFDWIPELANESDEKLSGVLFNSLTASSAVFSEAFNNFFSADEKVSFHACKDRIILRSLDDQSKDSISNVISELKKLKTRKPGFTELVISEKELVSYVVKVENEDGPGANQIGDRNTTNADVNVSELENQNVSKDDSKSPDNKQIVFSLKYFKLVLSLLQVLNLDLNLSFGRGGVPMRILLSETNLFKGEYWIATTTLSSNSDDSQTQNTNLKSKNNKPQVQQVTLKDLPDDFPEDENFDNFICSLAVEEQIENVVEQPGPSLVIDFEPEQMEKVPCVVDRNPKDPSKRLGNESSSIDRNQKEKEAGLYGEIQITQKSGGNRDLEKRGSSIESRPVEVQFIDTSSQDSVSVDLNEVARKKIRLSQNTAENYGQDESQSAEEEARIAVYLIMFGNDEDEIDDQTAFEEGGILVAESDEES